MTTLTPGARLGPYEILSSLGSGGMGEVYEARDSRLDRTVAVKVLPRHAADRPEALARFEREARAVAALSHPNIVAIHDIGTDAGVTYAVMERLKGETLRHKLGAGPLPARKALEYGVQIAGGLAAAHAQGIAHRDLKPENLWVTPDGHVKILDFGLARTTARPTEGTASPTASHLTVPGTILGTVGYMSPEQVRGDASDARSDIFSLGVVLYEMIAGRAPFARATSVETMNAILKEEPADPGATGRGAPPALERIVRHCLEKDPEARFQSAHDLAFALRTALDAGSIAGDASSYYHGRGTDEGGRVRGRSPWISRGAAGVVILAALLAAFVAGRLWAAKGVEPSVAETAFRQLNLRPQTVFVARFGPDGRTIVYSGALQGNTPGIFVIRPEYPDPQALGDPGQRLLAVSSQGELALLTKTSFLSQRLFLGTLARMPLTGGIPREVLEGVRDADWSPDGAQLAIVREMEGRDRLEFPIGKVLHESSGYLSDMRVSPDGRRVAFFEHAQKWDDRGSLAVVDLLGKTTLLSREYSSLEGLAWAPGGDEVYFSGGDSLQRPVRAATLSGRERLVMQSAGGLDIMDASREGHWIAIRDQPHSWIMVKGPDMTAERDLSWLSFSVGVRISHDGRTIVFTDQDESAGPDYSACLRGTDGSAVVRLGKGMVTDLSSDGRKVLAKVPTMPQELLIYEISATGEAVALDRGPLEAYSSARWFPDGRRILVCGNEKDQAPRCYVQETGAPPRPVTPSGTRDGLPSPDGRTLLARGPDGAYNLYPFEGGLEGGAPRPLPAMSAGSTAVRWSADGRSVYYYFLSEVPARLRRLDLRTGRSDPFMEVAPQDRAGLLNIYEVSLSADERWYAYTAWQSVSSLFIVEGTR